VIGISFAYVNVNPDKEVNDKTFNEEESDTKKGCFRIRDNKGTEDRKENEKRGKTK